MHVEKARIERKGRKDLVQSSPQSFKNTNIAHVSSHVFIFDFNRKVDPLYWMSDRKILRSGKRSGTQQMAHYDPVTEKFI
jgi:hypothetical protein